MTIINNGIHTTIEQAVVSLFPYNDLETIGDMIAADRGWVEEHARANEEIRAHLIAEGVNFD